MVSYRADSRSCGGHYCSNGNPTAQLRAYPTKRRLEAFRMGLHRHCQRGFTGAFWVPVYLFVRLVLWIQKLLIGPEGSCRNRSKSGDCNNNRLFFRQWTNPCAVLEPKESIGEGSKSRYRYWKSGSVSHTYSMWYRTTNNSIDPISFDDNNGYHISLPV